MPEDGKKLDDKTLEGITGGVTRRVNGKEWTTGTVTVTCPLCSNGETFEVSEPANYICPKGHRIINGMAYQEK